MVADASGQLQPTDWESALKKVAFKVVTILSYCIHIVRNVSIIELWRISRVGKRLVIIINSKTFDNTDLVVC